MISIGWAVVRLNEFLGTTGNSLSDLWQGMSLGVGQRAGALLAINQSAQGAEELWFQKFPADLKCLLFLEVSQF